MKYFVLLCSLLLCSCHQPSVPAAQSALRIMGPAHLSISATSESIKFSPELRLTNLTDSVIAIAYFGSQIRTAQLQYRFTDDHGKEVPLLRRDFLGSTLAGTRIGTTFLLPGKSQQWTPEEALVYPKVAKGRYRLVAHLEIDPPDPVFEAGRSDADKGQIGRTRHIFNSEPLEITVE